ncbi:PFGI-1 class ICE element type IV pilus protein PilL2 [Methylomagnum sp.]
MPRPATALPLLALLVTGCAPSAAPPAGVASLRQSVAYRNPAGAAPPERTQTGRYSYVANGPAAAQIDPLLAIIEVRLPQGLDTVGLAADYLLKRSGYCLMEPGATEVRHLLRLPLPEVHRHLGPMTLREALLALGGTAYELVVDPVYREVGYRVIAPKGSAS